MGTREAYRIKKIYFLFQTDTTPEAINYESKKKSIELYESLNILTKREIESRVDIKLDAFSNTKTIELKVGLELVRKEILPAITKQINELATAYTQSLNAKIDSLALQKDINVLEKLYSSIQTKETYIQKFISKTESIEDSFKLAQTLAEKGEELLLSLREDVDAAEKRISADYWNLPSYDELLLNFFLDNIFYILFEILDEEMLHR